MTTIFASAELGEMASDSKITEETTWFPGSKMRRLRDGAVYGFSGDAAAIAAWVAWFDNGRPGKKPRSAEGVTVLRLGVDGVSDVSGSPDRDFRFDRGYHAIGSGSSAALGAWEALTIAQSPARSPATAVEIACGIDVCSGGAVVVMRLADAGGC